MEKLAGEKKCVRESKQETLQELETTTEQKKDFSFLLQFICVKVIVINQLI